eukprot:TRINITY_DN73833_c0_g1_i1.p1 TRINITY_DN73833_c0_g1~~TRINITY_DN73833_c0_g1_i1.p1  ORF type:complete len:372 (+),score=77.14 TRINITY_DN73833_c0_g1_i1:158-1117(+)
MSAFQRSLALSTARPRRKNSWDWPPTHRQVIAIVVVFLDGVAAWLLVHPMLESGLQQPFAVLFGLSFATLVVAAALTMTVDPVDPAIRGRVQGTKEMLECRHCRSAVNLDSKHCWECRKCVDVFDHHCPWLNTCIGARNYGYFFVTVWSLLVNLVLLCTASAGLLVLHFFGDAANHIENGRTVVLLALTTGVNLPLGFLDMTLLSFHCYLVYKDLTTYEYLRPESRKRLERKAAARRAEEQARLARRKVVTESESDSHSSDDGLVGAHDDDALDVFRAIVPDSEDTDVAKEINGFVFGSFASGVHPSEPERQHSLQARV